MCDVVERILNEGRVQGITEGKEELIKNLIESEAGTIEQIAAWVKLPVKKIREIAERISVPAGI